MIYNFVKLLLRIALYPFFLPRITGKENIPKQGGYIISANHTSNFDPIFTTLPQKRKVYFLAKAELFGFKPFGWFIEKMGARPLRRESTDIHALRLALSILKSGNPLTVYPQGKRTDSYDMDDMKTGVALLAVKAKVPVLPIGIQGKYRLFSRIKITIGKPISFEEYYDQKITHELSFDITEQVLDQIKVLAGV